MDQRTPATYIGADRDGAQRLLAAQGALVSLAVSVARGEVRPGDQMRAQALLQALGMGD